MEGGRGLWLTKDDGYVDEEKDEVRQIAFAIE